MEGPSPTAQMLYMRARMPLPAGVWLLLACGREQIPSSRCCLLVEGRGLPSAGATLESTVAVSSSQTLGEVSRRVYKRECHSLLWKGPKNPHSLPLPACLTALRPSEVSYFPAVLPSPPGPSVQLLPCP